MNESKDKDDNDWVDRLTGIAESLGFNPVRVRWKLEGLRKRYAGARFRAGEQTEHVKYRHKICASCGRLNDNELTHCARCGEPLGSRGWHVLQRIGVGLPDFLSVSSLLGIAIVLVYGRMLLSAGPGEGIMSFDVVTLLRFGGSWAPAVFAGGEYWRLGTCIFIHAGIWHIGFNLFALSQIGPKVEEVFGRGRMLVLFMVTGLLASLGSALSTGIPMYLESGSFAGVGGGVSIGASGAMLGLTGVAAGWGHREGTTLGRELRNQMLKWCVYTLIFGAFIGADNMAHIVGFVVGGALGFVVPPQSLKRSVRLPVVVAQTTLGGLGAIGFTLLCLIAPPSPATDLFERWIQLGRRQITLESEYERICDDARGESFDFKWYEVPLVGIPDMTEEEFRVYLRSFCEQRRRDRQIREHCELFRSEGIEAVLRVAGELPRLSELDDQNRQELARSFREVCGVQAGIPPRRK